MSDFTVAILSFSYVKTVQVIGISATRWVETANSRYAHQLIETGLRYGTVSRYFHLTVCIPWLANPRIYNLSIRTGKWVVLHTDTIGAKYIRYFQLWKRYIRIVATLRFPSNRGELRLGSKNDSWRGKVKHILQQYLYSRTMRTGIQLSIVPLTSRCADFGIASWRKHLCSFDTKIFFELTSRLIGAIHCRDQLTIALFFSWK